MTTTFRPDTGFPYLALAQEINVDYASVLMLSDMIEARYLRLGELPDLQRVADFIDCPRWIVDAIFHATHKERQRREAA